MDTDLASQAAQANEVIKDSPPEVGAAAPTTVTLLRGALDLETGEWQTVATVREMTGEDEEELARLSTNDTLTYADYTSALLGRAVVSIGNQSVREDPSLLDHLIIGDRDLLFLGVIKATYGNVRDFTVTCGKCEKANDVQVNLDTDFPVTEPKSDPTVPRLVTLKNGTTVKVKYLTGGDSAHIANTTNTVAEQNTALVASAVVWDDDRSEAVKEHWARGLSLADRKQIISTVLEDQPGPTMEEVDAPCGHCGEQITMLLDWASLLLG